jgi:hypothetical protein
MDANLIWVSPECQVTARLARLYHGSFGQWHTFRSDKRLHEKKNAQDRCSLSYLHPVHFEVVEVMARLPGCPTTPGQPMRLMRGIGPYLL